MRPVRAVSLYLVLVFVGGALLAPWLYALVQSASGFLPGFQTLAGKPFARYVSRSFLILGVIGLWPFLRTTDLATPRAIGWARRPEGLSQLGWGFALGLGSLACIVFVVLAFEVRAIAPERGAGAVLGHFIKAAAAAVLVAPMEEVFFRGVLFGALRKTFHWVLALLVSSAIYALLHFLERAHLGTVVGWTSGLAVFGQMLTGFTDPAKLIPGFLNLTLAGVILGLAYQRTGSLHFSIGLHAGWIFWLKTYGFVTCDSDPSRTWFFGTDKLIDGWLAFLVMLVVFGVVGRVLVQENPQVGWQERRLFS